MQFFLSPTNSRPKKCAHQIYAMSSITLNYKMCVMLQWVKTLTRCNISLIVSQNYKKCGTNNLIMKMSLLRGTMIRWYDDELSKKTGDLEKEMRFIVMDQYPRKGLQSYHRCINNLQKCDSILLRCF